MRLTKTRDVLSAMVAAFAVVGCTDEAVLLNSSRAAVQRDLRALRRKFEDVEGDLLMLAPKIKALEEASNETRTDLTKFQRNIVAPFIAEGRRELARLNRAVGALAPARAPAVRPRDKPSAREGGDEGRPALRDAEHLGGRDDLGLALVMGEADGQHAQPDNVGAEAPWKAATVGADPAPGAGDDAGASETVPAHVMAAPGETRGQKEARAASQATPLAISAEIAKAPAGSAAPAVRPSSRDPISNEHSLPGEAARQPGPSGKKTDRARGGALAAAHDSSDQAQASLPKNYQDIIEAYHNVVARYPGTDQAVEAWLAIGLIEARLERLDRARRAFETATRSRSSGPLRDRAHLELARLESRRGRHAKARKALMGLLDSSPESDFAPEISLDIAGTYEAEGDIKSALMAYARTEKAFPGSVVALRALRTRADIYWSQGDTDRAAIAYENLLERARTPAIKSSAMLRLAEAAVKQGEPGKARKLLLKLCAEYPQSEAAEPAAFLIGRTYLDDKSSMWAARAYLSAARQYPSSEMAPSALLDAGDSLIRSELLLEALETYKKALALAATGKKGPEFEKLASSAQLRIANTLARIGKTESAVKEYRQFIKQFPDNPLVGSARRRLGQAYSKLLMWDEARAELVASADGADDKEAFEALVSLADVEEKTDRLACALSAIEQALGLGEKSLAQPNGTRMRLVYRMGLLLDRQGRTKEALERFHCVSSAKDFSGADSELPLLALFRAGRCLERLGQESDAEQAYTRFLEAVPQDGHGVPTDLIRRAKWSIDQIRFVRDALNIGHLVSGEDMAAK